jgi:hypothetical protein
VSGMAGRNMFWFCFHLQATPGPLMGVTNEESLNNLNWWDCVKVTQEDDLADFQSAIWHIFIDSRQ